MLNFKSVTSLTNLEYMKLNATHVIRNTVGKQEDGLRLDGMNISQHWQIRKIDCQRLQITA